MGSAVASAAGAAAESDKYLGRAPSAKLRGWLVDAPPRQALAFQDQPQLGRRHLNAPSLLRLVLSGDTPHSDQLHRQWTEPQGLLSAVVAVNIHCRSGRPQGNASPYVNLLSGATGACTEYTWAKSEFPAGTLSVQ